MDFIANGKQWQLKLNFQADATFQRKNQDIVDLWVMGIYFTEFIHNKSMHGFMGIYG